MYILSMALIIENGTGVTGADSYGTRSGFIAHVANYYGGIVADTDASDVPMRAAFAYMNALGWKGTRTLGRGQVGAFPRTDLTDCEGIAITTDEIPTEVILAQYDLAWAELGSPGLLSPSGSIRDSLVSMEKVDVIQVEYDTTNIYPGQDVTAVRVDAAMRRIACFLNNGGSMGRMTYAVTI